MSDGIRLRCERCNSKLRVPADATGRSIRCPTCRADVKLPSVDPNEPAPVDYTEGVEPPTPPSIPLPLAEPDHDTPDPPPRPRRHKPARRTDSDEFPVRPTRRSANAEVMAGRLLALSPWAGMALWLVGVMFSGEVIANGLLFRPGGGQAVRFGLVLAVFGAILIVVGLVGGCLGWAYLGADPRVRLFRVAGIGGFLAVGLTPVIFILFNLLRLLLA